jgi:hypothetical protein
MNTFTIWRNVVHSGTGSMYDNCHGLGKRYGKNAFLPWRRGVVVIVSAKRTGDRGFESRQGVRFSRTLHNAMLFFVT